MAAKKKLSGVILNAEADGLREQVEALKLKLADRVDKHDKDGKALIKALNELEEVTRERDAYKKAKQENDDRFCGERDQARQELAEYKAWAEEELANAQRQANAAIEDMRQQVKDARMTATTSGVLFEVQKERERQNIKWGEQNHPDGTCAGPGGERTAKEHADAAKAVCNHFAKIGQLTWSHILTEEMMEAYAETDPEKLRVELIQVAAVATQWVESIDRRLRGRKG